MFTPGATGQYSRVDQPIPFDHRHHVVDAGIDCRYCHDLGERFAYAGVPPTAKCLNCHGQIRNSSPLLEPVRRSFFEGTPIVWRRVNRLPAFVYFNHAIHVTKGIGCVECHGRVDQMARVYQATPMTMGWCLGCHRAPEPHLRPQDQITSMTWQPPADGGALQEESERVYGVRHLTECSACHR